MYGWAWLLRLVAELETWQDPQAQQWRENLRPLEKRIVDLTIGYLPRLQWPIRTGVHPDTAFALAQTLDYARIVGNQELEKLIVDKGRQYYLDDKDYNASMEPSGEDFFSPSLNEADFVRRIVSPEEFSRWLNDFLPGLKNGSLVRLGEPVKVSDVTDGKLVHLAGLDFSRAWCWQGIASALTADDPRAKFARRAASEHISVGLEYVFSGHYEGEHWLGTFALYAMTEVGLSKAEARSQDVQLAQAPAKLREYEVASPHPDLAKFHLRKAPTVSPVSIRQGDRLAIVGDSITEQKMYSRMIETYLTVCQPQLQIDVRQYGWSGEKADGFLRRMENDCLRFQPTLATVCYGMNDARYRPFDIINGEVYRDNLTQVVRRFAGAGTRVIVGSPGCSGKIASWVQEKSGTLDEHNLHLAALRDIGIEVAHLERSGFADIFWPMYQAQALSKELFPNEADPYAIAGKDGIHPGWAGQTIMAFAFLNSMGLDGTLAELELDIDASKATSSNGHELDRVEDGVYHFVSHRYPFCSQGPIDRDDSIRSGMTWVPFQQRLNRFMLRIPKATSAKYRITWGDQSQEISGDELRQGVNLAHAFQKTPFDEAFRKVDDAVFNKQAFETKQIKEIFHGQAGKEDMAKAVEQTEATREERVREIHSAFQPVRHAIQIQALP